MSRRLSASDIESRHRLDWRVVQKMCGGNYQFTAHRTPQDATAGVNSITREPDARFALHYRARYGIKTLIGPDKYSSYTIIHVDVCDPLYPFTQPSSWVVEDGGSRVPYSPHFEHNTPVCNGTIWRADGNILLGHYLIHLARLLNWDESLAKGYGGYNPAAIAWWTKHLGRPLTPDLRYPVLPADEAYGIVKPGFLRLQPRGSFRKVGQP